MSSALERVLNYKFQFSTMKNEQSKTNKNIKSTLKSRVNIYGATHSDVPTFMPIIFRENNHFNTIFNTFIIMCLSTQIDNKFRYKYNINTTCRCHELELVLKLSSRVYRKSNNISGISM